MILQFQRTAADPKFELKKIQKPVQIVYASTGITASTTKVVSDVRAKKEADPAWWDALMAKYLSVVERAGKDGGISLLRNSWGNGVSYNVVNLLFLILAVTVQILSWKLVTPWPLVSLSMRTMLCARNSQCRALSSTTL